MAAAQPVVVDTGNVSPPGVHARWCPVRLLRHHPSRSCPQRTGWGHLAPAAVPGMAAAGRPASAAGRSPGPAEWIHAILPRNALGVHDQATFRQGCRFLPHGRDGRAGVKDRSSDPAPGKRAWQARPTREILVPRHAIDGSIAAIYDECTCGLRGCVYMERWQHYAPSPSSSCRALFNGLRRRDHHDRLGGQRQGSAWCAERRQRVHRHLGPQLLLGPRPCPQAGPRSRPGRPRRAKGPTRLPRERARVRECGARRRSAWGSWWPGRSVTSKNSRR